MEKLLNEGELEHSMRDHRGRWEEQELSVLVVGRSRLMLPHKQIFYSDRTHKGQSASRPLEAFGEESFYATFGEDERLMGWLRMLAGASFYRGRIGGMVG